MRVIWSDPGLRVVAAMMVLFGAFICGFAPYVSALAVGTFGLGDAGFAAIIVCATLVTVSLSVLIGLWTDRTGRRRGVAMACAAALVVATGAMSVWPSGPAFVLAHAALIPAGGTLYSQVFALARILALQRPAAERDGVMASLRAMLALPFVAVLPLWSVAFAAGVPVLSIYPVGMVFAGLILLLAWRFWPAAGSGGAPSGLSFRAGLAEMARPAIALRVVALGAVSAAATVYMAVIALVLVPDVGRGPADVALYVGLVAGLEVPFMLMLPWASARLPRVWLIFGGACLYALHLGALPLIGGSGWLWLMVLPAAVGGAATLALPIAYLQDQLADRAGAGASLLALQRLAGDVVAAGCFVLGTALAGYGLVAALGVVVSVAGAAVVVLADRRRG